MVDRCAALSALGDAPLSPWIITRLAMSTVTFADRGHPTVYQPVSAELYSRHYARTALPIVIDNGTFECRAGWAHAQSPSRQQRVQ